MKSKQSIANRKKIMSRTPEERKELASLAGKARWKKTTKEQRIKYAYMMVKARKLKNK
jgi:hypothetical protein